jgi:hypothetical protein
MKLKPAGAVAAMAMMALVATGVAEGRRVHLFVKVVDSVALPVLDMRPEEFVVTERGVRREITRLRLADAPMRIVLLVDTSSQAGRALTDLRAGVEAFVDRIPQPHEIALVTAGRRPRVRVPPTRDRELLRQAANAMFADRSSGTVLLDALLESYRRFVEGQDVPWPVFVILSTDGPESSPAGLEVDIPRLIADFDARNGTAHAMILAHRGRAGAVIQGQAARALAETTRGYFEVLAISTSLPDRLRNLAALVTDQHRKLGRWYELEFDSGSSDPQTPVSVNVVPRGLQFTLSIRRPLDQLGP